MATVIKVKGDATDVQTDFNHAPVDLYRGKAATVEAVNSNNSGKPQVKIRWELTKTADGKKLTDSKGKPVSYASVFYYAPLDLTDKEMSPGWARRLKELLVAFGMPMKGANLAKIEGQEALLRLREDTDQDGEYRPQVGKILPLNSKVDDDEEEDDEEEDDEEEGVDLDEMSRAEMKAYIKENELGIRVLSKDDDDTLREKIREAMPEDEEEEEEEEVEEEEDEEEDEVDLDELSRKELRAFIKENELDVKVTAKMKDDAIRDKIREALGEDEEEEEEEDEADDNYDELTIEDLRQECTDRELESKGKKATLIARLRKDDLENPV